MKSSVLLATVFFVTASASAMSAGAQTTLMPPCEATPPPGPQRPLPPRNLRILSGPGAFEAMTETQEVTSGPHAYYFALASRPDCFKALSLRSQAQIDSIEKGGANSPPGSIKWPSYDAAHDAMVQRTTGGGGINAVQKQPKLGIKQTSMMLTYDFKIGPGAEYKGDEYLQQYKAYRLDQGSNVSLWLSTKLKFKNNIDRTTGQPAIAEMLTTGGAFMGPGTTNANSEILQPKLADFWPKVTTWTRYWLLVEGALGGGRVGPNPNRPEVSSDIVYVSIWAADENTEPIQLYDRLQMYSPVEDIRQFRFEYNTSEPFTLVNPVMEFWNRNFVVLTGVTKADMPGLLQKPVK